MNKNTSYNVILWDFNKKDVEYYDIMPYLKKQWAELLSHKRKKIFYKPESFDEIKEWILNESKYRFWSRCEYEIMVQGVPSQDISKKIDAYNQIKTNIDVITNLFIENL